MPTSGYQLSDRHTATDGRVLLTGVQALARLPIEQVRRDRRAGRNTAAFLSGYPGSPLGGLDQEIERARRLVPELPIVHQPAVNEELGATAVMGSQLAASRPDATYDGVTGWWYGKAPGLDRAGDAMRHGVFAGTSALGGAVVLVGDDPACKSSTMPSSSDATLVDLHMPILYPGSAAECLELGLHAVAVSRASGLWSAMKIVTPVADGSGTVDLPVLDREPSIPTVEVGGEIWRCRPSAQFLGPRMLQVEQEFREIRLPLAHEYGILNGLNRVTVDPPDAWIGLVATGFTYREMIEALARLGLDDEQAIARCGIRLLQLRMPVPFDAELVRRFARGLDEVVVVEEKNPTLEWLIKDALYGGPDQPVVVGKHHEDGRTLFRSWGQLDADAIVDGVRARLDRRVGDRLAPPPPPERERVLIPLDIARAPYFCSGCPHNWGTKVPDGALVGAGTGCHGMTLLMDEERVGEGIGITAMGNEGVQWIGMEPFVAADHLFQNYGDGTFFHSGQLAIQNCIGAGKNMTFKILYNSTVAMTGGQDSVSVLPVPDLCRALLAHGVARIAITTDDTARYRRVDLPDGVDVHDRTRIVDVQKDLAAQPGVTVLIHDQECAAELRRDRKRGRAPRPSERIVINHRICEGCGDCGDVSGCLSLRPVHTDLGRKTTIDQASCNIDLSCLHGDCPAFMTVSVDDSSAPDTDTRPRPSPPVGLPAPPPGPATARLRLAGIGGTGVVTAAQILATAAMFDGWDVHGLDQTGLSQKAGPVISDVTLTRHGDASNLVGWAQADAIIGFDALVAAGDNALRAARPGHTIIVASTSETPTGAMVTRPGTPYPSDVITRRLADAGAPGVLGVDAAEACIALTGSAAPANIFVLGMALQTGAVPITPESAERAIELNGVAVDANIAAFRWGRAWVVDQATTESAISAARGEVSGRVLTRSDLPSGLRERIEALARADRDLRDLVEMLAGDLVDYQDLEYATDFVIEVARIADRENRAVPGSTRLTEAVARHLHKLMAYKDEYEVARLMLGPEAAEAARSVGGDSSSITWHLHPPLLAALGLDSKIRVGSWARPVCVALTAGRRLRGRAWDPFGRTELRRAERALVAEYRATLARLGERVSADSLDDAVRIASLPDMVRGYETLKMRRIGEYRRALADALGAAPWSG